MSEMNYKPSVVRNGTVEQIDEGLRQYMIKIFNYMGAGLCVTALSAWLTFNSPLISWMFSAETGLPTIFGWLLMLAPLALALIFNSVTSRGSLATLQTVFWIYSATIGVSLAIVLLPYTRDSIAQVFLITATTFGVMSFIGYTTKKDLTSIGSFLVMGLWGVIIASIINIFWQNSGLSLAISYISVLVFVGLTAWDTQKLKTLYYASGNNDDLRSRIAISGALSLYLDFVNLFIDLLRIMGSRNR
jgi:hypothetical protein